MKRLLIGITMFAVAACAVAEPPYYWKADKYKSIRLANEGESTAATMNKTWFDKLVSDDATETITGYWLFTTNQPDFNAGIGFASGAESITYNGANTEFDFTGPINAENLDTGLGNTELYLMNQNLRTSDDVDFHDVQAWFLQAEPGEGLTVRGGSAEDIRIEHSGTGTVSIWDFSDRKIILGDRDPDYSGNKITVDWDPAAGEPTLLTDGSVDMDANVIRLRDSDTPTSTGATGLAGQIKWDTGYVYVCTASDTWKRAALSTW